MIIKEKVYTENGGPVADIKNEIMNKADVQFDIFKTKFVHDIF